MIADVVFDAPMPRAFSYHVPDRLGVGPGQRVVASLRGASRVGMVVGVREGDGAELKPLLRVLDGEPIVTPAQLDLLEWIADESLSSLGSTAAALLPPPLDSKRAAPDARAETAPDAVESPRERASSGGAGDDRKAPPRGERSVEVFVGAGRERRVLERVADAPGAVLVLVPDLEAAGRWAQRLAKLGRVARLDSGVDDAARRAAWADLAAERARVAVGTRSAMLVPLAPPATLVLVDEHEAAHKPPGPPRIHAREVVLERAARERATALLASATPSVETWWRADSGRDVRGPASAAPWPRVSIADTRGILRREALTPALARAMREALAAGRRVFLAVSRVASALACDECGEIVRCPECGIALAYGRAAATLTCRLCGAVGPAMERCPTCRGARLSPFGWGAERVEHSVRRRFPHANVARFDPDATRGAKADAQRAAAAAADVVIGTRGALRLFGPTSLGVAGFVSPDQLLRQPDFRASERAFAFLWAAAERVHPEGEVVVQSQNPGHYALEALAAQELSLFYKRELSFRGELGYPPFRRLALVTVRGASAADSERTADAVVAALRGSRDLTVYPPAPGARKATRQVVAKGRDDLPRVLRAALDDFIGRRGRGIIDVEVDPVEWF